MATYLACHVEWCVMMNRPSRNRLCCVAWFAVCKLMPFYRWQLIRLYAYRLVVPAVAALVGGKREGIIQAQCTLIVASDRTVQKQGQVSHAAGIQGWSVVTCDDVMRWVNVLRKHFNKHVKGICNRRQLHVGYSNIVVFRFLPFTVIYLTNSQNKMSVFNIRTSWE